MTFKKSNFLKEMSWTRFEGRKKDTDLVIIPSGAFEVYGYHLPLGTDTLVSVKIAEILAERVNAIIGPTLEVGDSTALEEFPGTMVIKAENFKQYLWDTVKSLEKWGFKKFLFINSHAGNVPIINQVARDLQSNSEIQCAQIDYWRFIKNHDNGIIESGELAHTHASEAGTSVMMYLYPELCDLEKWVNEPPKTGDDYPDIIKYIPFSEKTDSGTIGDATLGTKEKGEKLVNRSVNRIVEFLVESWEIKELEEKVLEV
ncbi:creatininase family protein [Psychrobacillus sp. OK032]|uniref:creatininase family protein n=1 Tax=Psychrobacillus sp. OK032 TaxID=1884358 RepID=UPI0008D2F7B5|nr:creatininase family protein [Psychrobacillus sp. OK032]SER77962.1 creatinine amidohydrolase [Psychrobacillus sp. OK032]